MNVPKQEEEAYHTAPVVRYPVSVSVSVSCDQSIGERDEVCWIDRYKAEKCKAVEMCNA